METKKIKDRTVKDLLEVLLGKKNAENVLTKIQKEYDKGVSSKAFKDFVKRTFDEIPDFETGSVNLAVSLVALTYPVHSPNT
jgi:hypothetical protein